MFPLFQKFEELNKRGVRTYWLSPPCVDQIKNPSDREIELWEYNMSYKESWTRARANQKPWAEVFASPTLSRAEWLSLGEEPHAPQIRFNDGSHTFYKGAPYSLTAQKRKLFMVQEGFRVTTDTPPQRRSGLYFLAHPQWIAPLCQKTNIKSHLLCKNYYIKNTTIQNIWSSIRELLL
jgi:hypothetical protein